MKIFDGLLNTINGLFLRKADIKPISNTDTSKEIRGNISDVDPPYTSSYDWYVKELQISQFRKDMYDQYDQMEAEDPEFDSTLDIYADNASGGDSETDEIVEFVTEDKKANDIFTAMKNRLKLNSETWSINRTIAKYGESFEEIVITPSKEIDRLKNLDGRTITRNEDRYGRLLGFIQKSDTDQVLANFYPWQVIHFRMKKHRNSKYGTGIGYSTRKVSKQLSMMEDSLVISRLVRAVQRYAHKVDISKFDDPYEALKYVKEVKKEYRKKPTINAATNQMDLSYNPMSAEEDLFIGVRDGSPADVKVLEAQEHTKIVDVDYFRDKKLAGWKIPKSFISDDKTVNAKATLGEQTIQFARTVRRIQYVYQEGIRQMADTELILNNIAPSTVTYYIKLPYISTLDELRRWEMEKIKSEIAEKYKTVTTISDRWIYKNLLNLTDEEIEQIKIDNEEELRSRISLAQELNPATPQTSLNIEMVKLQHRNRLKDIAMLTDWRLGKEAKEEHVY